MLSPSCGAVDSTGLYTAPSLSPQRTDVTVTATSQADPSKFARATVHLVPVSFSISPSGPLNVLVNATQNFTATVNGDSSNAGVVWSLDASALLLLAAHLAMPQIHPLRTRHQRPCPIPPRSRSRQPRCGYHQELKVAITITVGTSGSPSRRLCLRFSG